jgi:hypothetical protein
MIQKYSVNQHPIQTLLSWIRSGEIAIPEIQRPFVWSAAKVRDLIDSLYTGYPVGYLIAWRNPKVRLKDGTSADGKRILIDGQQRVTALMAALMGRTILTKSYERTRVTIAFHPQERKFEVSNPAIRKDKAWVADIADVLSPEAKLLGLVMAYCEQNPESDQNDIFESLELLRGIVNNHIGLIELNSDLDIETVTEIFIRINSQGVVLSQADFAMSKIAANETYGGNTLRKSIDYFCHLATAPEFYQTITELDAAFATTPHFQKMAWLRHENDDLYDPSYTDMLRVAFTSEFKRGRLADLVALLSGRNFETRGYEEAIAEASFGRLERGVLNFMNETNFKRFIMILRSAGFVDASMIRSQNAVNFAYIVYLFLRDNQVTASEIETYVKRWFVLSILTGRYSAGAPESAFDVDIRRMHEQGMETYLRQVEAAELSDAFWNAGLPQQMDTPVASSPYFNVFMAAQVRANDKGFLSRDITVSDLLTHRGDIHHVFPRSYLKRAGFSRSRYNQIANYVLMQSEINIALGDKAPARYVAELLSRCEQGEAAYGGIRNVEQLQESFAQHCIPLATELLELSGYDAFLTERRRLMAQKMKEYYFRL